MLRPAPQSLNFHEISLLLAKPGIMMMGSRPLEATTGAARKAINELARSSNGSQAQRAKRLLLCDAFITVIHTLSLSLSRSLTLLPSLLVSSISDERPVQ
mmetsp:Transcript_20542/g.78734  ORF Transcript_20542/g.78734 Transcript_20542/m.78734 type:complete len:100 (-) Transcript_20542:95-394(-)